MKTIKWIGRITETNLSINLAIPIIPGMLYLIDGYKNYFKKLLN